MISIPAYTAITAACGNWINPPRQCRTLVNAALDSIGDIDVYNIYDVCGNDNLPNPITPRPSANPFNQILRAPNRALRMPRDPVICVPTALSTTYINNAGVRAAIHVQNSNLRSWGECYGINYNTNLVSLLPLYPKLISNMNVLIYSGDADACVPWNGSYNWTRHLGLTETTAWRPWTFTTPQKSWTGGFVTQWGKNFTFITIKHAGHMVPQFEPEASIVFYSAFLKGTIPQ